MLILDLDRFKEVNDTLRPPDRRRGAAGRRPSAACRVPGLRPARPLRRRRVRRGAAGAGSAEAQALAERTREALRLERFRGGEGGTVELAVSFSIGVGAAPADGSTGEGVLHAADRRLYDDKRQRQGAGARPSRRGRLAALLVALGVVLGLAWVLGPGEPFRSAPLAIGTSPPLRGAADRPGGRPERPRADRPSPGRGGSAAAGAHPGARTGRERRRGRASSGRARGHPARARGPGDLARHAAAGRNGRGAPGIGPDGAPRARGLPVSGEPRDGPFRVCRRGGAASAPAVASYTPPELLSVVRPDYPPMARRLRRTAAVELRVRVDAGGRVVEAVPLGPPAGLGFDLAAQKAALRAVFRPARRNGEAVAGRGAPFGALRAAMRGAG